MSSKKPRRPAQVYEHPPTTAAILLASLSAPNAPVSSPVRGLGPTIILDQEDKYDSDDDKENKAPATSPPPVVQPRPPNHQHQYRQPKQRNKPPIRIDKKSRSTITTTQRQTIINAILGEGLSRDLVSRSYKISINTVNTIIKNFRKTNRTGSVKRGGARESNVKYDMERLSVVIKNYLCGDPNFPQEEKNPFYTNWQIRRRLKDDFMYDESMWPSVHVIGEISSKIKLTYKEPTRLPWQRNSDDNKNLRHDWVVWATANVFPDQVIYIDECSFELHMHPKKGRAMLGEKLIVEVNGAKYHEGRVTAVMAVSPTLGVIFAQSVIGTFTKDLFHRFITRVCEVIRVPQASFVKYTFVYDNAPIHRQDILEETITNYGHQVKRLPPYSPFLNPIEEVFSLWKQGVRARQTDDNCSLSIAMIEAEKDITHEKIYQFYKHAVAFYNDCLAKKDIL